MIQFGQNFNLKEQKDSKSEKLKSFIKLHDLEDKFPKGWNPDVIAKAWSKDPVELLRHYAFDWYYERLYGSKNMRGLNDNEMLRIVSQVLKSVQSNEKSFPNYDLNDVMQIMRKKGYRINRSQQKKIRKILNDIYTDNSFVAVSNDSQEEIVENLKLEEVKHQVSQEVLKKQTDEMIVEAEAEAKVEAEVQVMLVEKNDHRSDLEKAQAAVEEARAKTQAAIAALAEAKAKEEAEAKALAEAKAKEEAEAKALAEAKAKEEAEIREEAEVFDGNNSVSKLSFSDLNMHMARISDLMKSYDWDEQFVCELIHACCSFRSRFLESESESESEDCDSNDSEDDFFGIDVSRALHGTDIFRSLRTKRQWGKKIYKLHRTDGPAVIRPDGTQEYFVHENRHRVDGPAVIRGDGTKEWWFEGKRHRVDGPAIEWHNGSVEYWLKGYRHRSNGPAVERIYSSGEILIKYYLQGKCHRVDGPAVEWSNGHKEWWYNNVKFDSFEEHKNFIREINGPVGM